MDLNKLRTFVTVADCGSISKAAERLYRTQPAISNQLKDLENELKISLFERRNARIFLTEEGQRLHQTAAEHIAVLEDAALRLREDKQLTAGTIRIAVEQDSIGYQLPKILSGFAEQFPNVRFELVASTWDKIEDLLINNEVDFGFMVYFYKREFFETHPVFTFSRTLVGSEEYLSRFPPVKKVEDLLNLSFVTYISEFGDIRWWLKKNGFSQLTSTFEKQPTKIMISDAYTLNEMLFAGMGIGFSFDEMAAQRQAKDQKLVNIFPDLEPMFGGVDLAYRKVRNESFLHESFRQYVVEYAKDHPRTQGAFGGAPCPG